MSAFLLGKTHIDYLMKAAQAYVHGSTSFSWYDEKMNYHRFTHEDVNTVGAMLWLENKKSVEHLYGPKSEGMWTHFKEYVYEDPEHGGEVDWVQVLSAIACYRYQSCEHPEWLTSDAFHFVQALEKRAIQNLPGYNDAAWEVTAERLAEARKVRLARYEAQSEALRLEGVGRAYEAKEARKAREVSRLKKRNSEALNKGRILKLRENPTGGRS